MLKGSGEIFGDGIPAPVDIGAACHSQLILLVVLEIVSDGLTANIAVGAGTGAVHLFVSE